MQVRPSTPFGDLVSHGFRYDWVMGSELAENYVRAPPREPPPPEIARRREGGGVRRGGGGRGGGGVARTRRRAPTLAPTLVVWRAQVQKMKPKKPAQTKASTMAQQKAKERASASSASTPKQWKMKKFENVPGKVYS